MARIILIALILAAIYFTARELLIRRILNLPQLLIVCVALAAALNFSTKTRRGVNCPGSKCYTTVNFVYFININDPSID